MAGLSGFPQELFQEVEGHIKVALPTPGIGLGESIFESLRGLRFRRGVMGEEGKDPREAPQGWGTEGDSGARSVTRRWMTAPQSPRRLHPAGGRSAGWNT